MSVIVLLRTPMRVEVPVRNAPMLVDVAVHAQRPYESRDAENDQCPADDALDGGRKMVGEPPSGENKRPANQEDHRRVSDTPAGANTERATPVRSAAHENPNGGEVIGCERVRGAEQEGGDEKQGR